MECMVTNILHWENYLEIELQNFIFMYSAYPFECLD